MERGGKRTTERGGGNSGVHRPHWQQQWQPAATLQILQSCWTSCSLHNRIRMNRPLPPSLPLPASSHGFILFTRRFYPALCIHGLFFPLSVPAPIIFVSPSQIRLSLLCLSLSSSDRRLLFLPVLSETLQHHPRLQTPQAGFW